MKKIILITFFLISFCAVDAAEFFCKYCGRKFASAVSLKSASCPRFKNKKKHEIFAGDIKQKKFFCEKCGRSATSIQTLVKGSCLKNKKDGDGKHIPFEGKYRNKYICKKCGREISD